MGRFTGFDSPRHIAAFLAFMAMPRSEIVAGIHSMYPDADAEALADAALSRQQSATTKRIVDERERAIVAEHDLTQTMHDEHER